MDLQADGFASNITVASGRWFLFRGQKILLNASGHIPDYSAISTCAERITDILPLGLTEASPCFAGRLPADLPLPPSLEFRDLRGLLGQINAPWSARASLAFQLVRWHHRHRYCTRCGGPLKFHTDERAKFCPRCNYADYPRIYPCIIVAIHKQDKILLARPKRIKKALFSVIAGYVEPGENLEEAVIREVKEEVGLKVKNIRYFGSQSWPFSSSLMAAFTAEHKTGIIRLDPSEIAQAGWYTANALPPVPTRGSISRALIDAFAAQSKSTS